MRKGLLELVCCPVCGGNIQLGDYTTLEGEIWEGDLQCQTCSATFPIRQGMPYLFVDDEVWNPKAREAEGWALLHKEMGIYEQDEDAVDLHVPYYPEEPWIRVGRSFDVALSHLNLTGEETVLDLGAGRGWAAKQFALRGCRVVALDIAVDDNVGLGRGRALMKHAGTYFERIIGDGERLPFKPEKFDIVFCAATLHHTSNLPLMVANVARVMKRGGRLCAINEPCIGILEQEEEILARDASQELRLGINEHRPTVEEYRAALEQSQLELLTAVPVQVVDMSENHLRAWAVDLGAVWQWPDLRAPRRAFRLVSGSESLMPPSCGPLTSYSCWRKEANSAGRTIVSFIPPVFLARDVGELGLRLCLV